MRLAAFTCALALLWLQAGSALALPCGDLDGDLDVDGVDAGLLQQHLATNAALDPAQEALCDVIDDGANGPAATPLCSIVDAAVMARRGALLDPVVDERCAAAAAPDPASPVEVTSACLTLGSGAQSAIVVSLLDLGGNPITGSSVTMMTDAGTLGSVSSAGNQYWAVLDPPASGTGATITIAADGVPLDTSPSVSFADPVSAPEGGAGGCPADGNLRVTVLDMSGAPLSGANVMVGGSEQTGLFVTDFGAAPDGANTAGTDPSGLVEFRDFGTNLDGPLTVTAAAAGYQYFSFVEIDAGDLVLALPQVDPTPATSIYGGDVAPLPAPDNDPIEFAAVVADATIDQLATFDLASLFGENECHAAGGLVGDLVVPSNIYLPDQCAVAFIGCFASIPEHSWSLPLEGGDRLLFALGGGLPLAVAQSGLEDALADAFDYVNAIGVDPVTVTPPTPVTLTAGISNAISAPVVTCTVSNAPVDADVYCLTGGDYDSGAFPSMTPGEGRLFVTGLKAGLAVAGPATLGLSVTSLVDAGDFAGMEYVGGALAFWDEANLAAPPGTARGSTAVFDRSNSSFDGTGGALAFADFFPIRTLARAGRDFSTSALPGGSHPPADYTRSEIVQVISETYSACVVNDSTRERRYGYWTVVAPGASDSFTLPTPPPGWPRAGLGGDLAGLVDVTATPEDDVLVWTQTTVYEGLSPSFDYDQIRLFDFRSFVTHSTTNEADY